MESKPLSQETWPEWRAYYLRLHFAFDVKTPDEFYDELRAFMGGLADKADQLPGDMDQDPVALVILARHLSEEDREQPQRALDVARRALASGDPQGMATARLASCLLSAAIETKTQGQLSPTGSQQLIEAVELLDKVVVAHPQARVSTMRGLIALHRNDPAALDLLKQGAEEHPLQISYTIQYVSALVSVPTGNGAFAETTADFLRKHPDDPHLKTLHAVALYRDGRLADAYQAWKEARDADEKVLKFLTPEVIAALDEGQWVSPAVASGLELLQQKQFRSAAPKFREALQENPQNFIAARFLSRALVNDALSSRFADDSARMNKLIAESQQLTQQFPRDAEMHLGLALLLNHAGRKVAALEALEKADELGVQHMHIPGFDYVREIRDGAQTERMQQTVGLLLLGVVSLFAVWLVFMFGLGSALALFTSRTPQYTMLTSSTFSTGEIWLERFYLLVLSLSLIVFYISVPFVALGLLAITLVLFGIMLVLRFIHFGILHRGFYAIWGVLRCAFLGESSEVFGMEVTEQEQPRLFATLQEVASRLETSGVDRAYLTPDSQLSVHESGSGPFGLFGRRRVMSIGVATLSSLSLTEFKAVLAHEYGHFSHQDTLYSRFISRVTGSLVNSLAVMQVAGGFVNYINPFYWFYWLYLRAYGLLAAGFSRSREFLADRRAALAYGKEAFVSGLTKVSLEGAMFSGVSIQNIRSELGQGRAYQNVFDALRQFRDQPEMVEPTRQLLEGMHSAKPSWFDTHPTLRERIDALRGLPEERETPDDSLAAELIEGLPEVEEQLTEMLTTFVQQNYDIIHVPM